MSDMLEDLGLRPAGRAITMPQATALLRLAERARWLAHLNGSPLTAQLLARPPRVHEATMAALLEAGLVEVAVRPAARRAAEAPLLWRLTEEGLRLAGGQALASAVGVPR